MLSRQTTTLISIYVFYSKIHKNKSDFHLDAKIKIIKYGDIFFKLIVETNLADITGHIENTNLKYHLLSVTVVFLSHCTKYNQKHFGSIYFQSLDRNKNVSSTCCVLKIIEVSFLLGHCDVSGCFHTAAFPSI